MLLWIKMLRDLKNNAVQFFSVFIMSFLALLMMAGFSSTTLKPLNRYLTETNYKDIDISLENMTYGTAQDIAGIEGVEAVTLVVNSSGKTTHPDSSESKMLLSYITDDAVSKMHVVEGVPYEPGMDGIWIDSIWAKEKGIACGDILNITTEGILISEVVRGLVYSPEYLYYVPDNTYLEPVYGEFGFGIMDISRCPSKEILFDEMLVCVSGVNSDSKITAAERARLNKMSEIIFSVLDNKQAVVTIKPNIDQLKYYFETYDTFSVIGAVFPNIFALIAILGIISTMTRVIGSQRTTIGALKALGFTTRKIMLHYMSYSVFIVFIGGLIGAITGFFVLGPINYENMIYYYQNPYECYTFNPTSIVYLLVLTAIGGLIGFLCNNKLLKKSASQILQPEAPKDSKEGWYEKLNLWNKIKFGTKWNIRDVSRNKLRTLIGLTGVMVCSLLLFLAIGLDETLTDNVKWQFIDLINAQNQILFESDADYETVYEYAKEYKGQMVQISYSDLYYEEEPYAASITVVDPGSNYRISDENGQVRDLPSVGALVTSKFSDLVGVKPGDIVSFRMNGEEDVCKVRITGYCKDPVNQGLVFSTKTYADINQQFNPNYVYTNMSVDKSIVSRSEIAAVNSIDDLITTANNQKASVRLYVFVLITMGIVLGVIVQYNLGTMSYNEKYKDMATLKVLGFSAKDLKALMLQQNVAIAVLGGFIGILIGNGSMETLMSAFGDSDDYFVSLSFVPFAVALIGTFAVTVIVNSVIVSKIDNIELAAALKS